MKYYPQITPITQIFDMKRIGANLRNLRIRKTNHKNLRITKERLNP